MGHDVEHTLACSSGRRLCAIVTTSFSRAALVWTGLLDAGGPPGWEDRGPVKELRRQGYQRSGRRARSGVAFQACLTNARGTCIGCGLAGSWRMAGCPAGCDGGFATSVVASLILTIRPGLGGSAGSSQAWVRWWARVGRRALSGCVLGRPPLLGGGGDLQCETLRHFAGWGGDLMSFTQCQVLKCHLRPLRRLRMGIAR